MAVAPGASCLVLSSWTVVSAVVESGIAFGRGTGTEDTTVPGAFDTPSQPIGMPSAHAHCPRPPHRRFPALPAAAPRICTQTWTHLRLASRFRRLPQPLRPRLRPLPPLPRRAASAGAPPWSWRALAPLGPWQPAAAPALPRLIAAHSLLPEVGTSARVRAACEASPLAEVSDAAPRSAHWQRSCLRSTMHACDTPTQAPILTPRKQTPCPRLPPTCPSQVPPRWRL